MFETVQTARFAEIELWLDYLLYQDAAQLSEHRVSLTWQKDGRLFSVGDDLESTAIVDKPVKKRWWQRNDADQNKLPFAFYQPATIVDVSVTKGKPGPSWYSLEFECGGERFSVGHRLRHRIEVLRVHRIVQQEDFSRRWASTSSRGGQRFRDGIHTCRLS